MANKITGDDNANQLLGTSGDDIIKGLGGNDYIYGGSGGADRMLGGKGDDYLDGASNDHLADTLLGGAGNDRVSGSALDILDGGGGTDFFTLDLSDATTGFDLNLKGFAKHKALVFDDGTTVKHMESGSISFGAGDDVVSTGGAQIALYGGSGDDTLTGSKLDDSLNGGAGDDIVDGGSGSDWASYGHISSGPVTVDLSIQGESQDTGNGGVDILISIENLQGSANDDVLIGDSHDNKIDSFAGADTLTGGGGADTFVFTYAGQSQSFSPVTITDIGNDDTIDVHGIDADRNTAGDQDFTLVDHFTGHAGQLIVFKSGADTVVQMDTNGDSSADEGIVLSGDHAGFDNFIL